MWKRARIWKKKGKLKKRVKNKGIFPLFFTKIYYYILILKEMSK